MSLRGICHAPFTGWVERGGAYLGLCAGAYYAASRCEFEPGSELEVIGERELCFFPGIARGAVFPGFDYRSERGAAAAPVVFRTIDRLLAEADGTWIRRQHSGGGSSEVSTQGETMSCMVPPFSAMTPQQNGSRELMAGQLALTGRASLMDQLTNMQPAPSVPLGSPSEDCSPSNSAGWAWTWDYSNGGPALLNHLGGTDLAMYSGQVDVLALYGRDPGMQEAVVGLANNSARLVDDTTGESGGNAPVAAAAAVRCRVGLGVAVLCGTHPELHHRWLATEGDVDLRTNLKLNQPLLAQNVMPCLAAEEGRRRAFMCMLLHAAFTAGLKIV